MEEIKYQINPNFLLRQVAEEYIIVPIEASGDMANAIMAPNETAVFIWQAFQQPRTISEVVTMILDKYDAPKDVIENSVNRFVSESSNLDILQKVQ
ncbi:MAG: PqqD family protein [Thomasclavelia sp.]